MYLNKLLPSITSLLIALLSIAYTPSANAQNEQSVDKIIAKVGKSRIILQSDLEQNFAQYKAENPDIGDSLKCTLLHEMIFQKILAEQADRDSIVVNEEAVEANMDNRIRYYISIAGSQERLEEQMGRTIFQMKEDNREMIREMMVADEMKNQILKSVKVTPIEVRKYFETIPADSLPFFPASVELGQIVIDPPASPEMDNYARTKLEDIRKQIVEEGKSFETMAGIYSIDPGSRDQGGDLGWVQHGQMVPEFEKAGFTPIASKLVKPYRVKESPVQFECKVVDIIETGKEGGAGTLIIAEMVLMHISPEVLTADGKIDQHKMDLVGRCGSDWYVRASGNALFEVPKPAKNLGIGFDKLPEEIRNSKVLTGNSLGMLANVEQFPDQDSIIIYQRMNKELGNIMQMDISKDDRIVLKHKMAQELLLNSQVQEAWKVLLS